ncbi:MAG: hypothetical protein HN778_01135 [Prolixibacteraceae bacterium]|nr:hypothetical protein [Prolixibacteraceae bacterium]MBT6005795.1 hypothetical protein [Prolixibacteraceae bacterium]MBT6765375.1 hypothetical protein [Prolixibacteraceae bacterium]MBT6998752.1 hypothetical protein [Prolixibacteraceae bacterium]MBT7393412.1 hypothetical protein [Prolixibacteraceae bacterium]
MEKKAKKSRLAESPAWALSLMTLFAPIVLGLIFEEIHLFESSAIEIGFLIVCFIFIIVACFFICMTHPKSVWYTPFICNAFIIIMLVFTALLDYEVRLLPLLIAQSGLIVLSFIGAFIGARIGRRLIIQRK